MINLGKKFEERFKIDWIESFPMSTVTRLYDVTSGYTNISTISDFICYNYPNQFFIECKTHKGASIPFTNITQYDKMIKEVGKPGVRVGVILWLNEKDKVYYIPTSTITKMKEDGKKSVGIKSVSEGYRIIEIPCTKLIHYMKCDFNCLTQLQDGE
jgi:penicillin-binding protein-related factor A (putative recombinase)